MTLAARGESPAAFGRRCILAGGVAPRSNIPDILTRRAWPAGRITTLGATRDVHHGLLAIRTRLGPADERLGERELTIGVLVQDEDEDDDLDEDEDEDEDEEKG